MNNPLTWNGGSLYVAAILCPWWPLAPCSESTAPFLVPLPNLHCSLLPSFPPTYVITMNTDDINMPESSSVRHRNVPIEGTASCCKQNVLNIFGRLCQVFGMKLHLYGIYKYYCMTAPNMQNDENLLTDLHSTYSLNI